MIIRVKDSDDGCVYIKGKAVTIKLLMVTVAMETTMIED